MKQKTNITPLANKEILKLEKEDKFVVSSLTPKRNSV